MQLISVIGHLLGYSKAKIDLDSLDLDLTRSEYEIITLVRALPLKIHLYARLVDDISIIAQ